jgi:hypothetical protein
MLTPVVLPDIIDWPMRSVAPEPLAWMPTGLLKTTDLMTFTIAGDPAETAPMPKPLVLLPNTLSEIAAMTATFEPSS